MSLRRAVLAAAGAVATAAGAHQAVHGLAGVHPVQPRPLAGDRDVDSELRFYGVWYAVAGIGMLRAASRPDVDRVVGPLAALGWGGAAASRLLSVRAVGRPSGRFLALAAAEAALAAVLAATDGDRRASCSRG